jgi:hypothetical protein
MWRTALRALRCREPFRFKKHAQGSSNLLGVRNPIPVLEGIHRDEQVIVDTKGRHLPDGRHNATVIQTYL